MAQEARLPWIIKYRPKRLDEVVDQEEAKAKILEWLKKWPNVPKKALLLYGPPGCGKTSLVEAVANELGYEVLEMNASDFRRKEDIEKVAIRASTMQSLIASGRKKLILLDEVDGIADREDAGGLEAVAELVKISKVPIVMTANNPWDPKLRVLREIAEFVEFKKLRKDDIIRILERICIAEKLKCDKEALDYIATRAEGDARAAINDLQAIGEGFGEVTLERAKALLRPRDKERDPFETLKLLFSAKYAWQAKSVLNQSQLDYEQLKLWLEENIPNQFSDLEDVSRAYEALSKADVYLGRIIRTGDWDLLAYAIDLMTAGVSLSAKNNPRDKDRWTKYSFPQRLLLMSKLKDSRKIRDDLATILAQHLHISTSTAKAEIIPILRAIFISNPEYAAKIAVGLGLSEKMIEMLAGPNKQVVIMHYRRLKEEIEKKAAETIMQLQAKAGRTEKPEARKEKKKEKSQSKTTSTDLTSYFKK